MTYLLKCLHCDSTALDSAHTEVKSFGVNSIFEHYDCRDCFGSSHFRLKTDLDATKARKVSIKNKFGIHLRWMREKTLGGLKWLIS